MKRIAVVVALGFLVLTGTAPAALFFPYAPVPADQAAAKAATIHLADFSSHYWVRQQRMPSRPPTFQCALPTNTDRLIVTGFATTVFDYARVTPRVITYGFVFKTAAMNDANWRASTHQMEVAGCLGAFSLPVIVGARASITAPVRIAFPRFVPHIVAYRYRLLRPPAGKQVMFGVFDLVIATRGRTETMLLDESIAGMPFLKSAPAAAMAYQRDVKLMLILLRRMQP
jgi:hypothetical protein